MAKAKKIKLKTHRGASKRFKKKGNGAFKFKKKGLRHILTKRTTKNKRQLRAKGEISACDVERVTDMLPNS